jgi:YhcH/YjgK/YiaL family protein
MIVDKLENAQSYYGLGKNFETAFKWLASQDLKTIAAGKYPIDGTNIHASVLDIDSKSDEAAKWESHKFYADIQFHIDGGERIGYTHISNTSVISHDEAKDFIHLSVKNPFYVPMQPGSFAVLFPQDAHQPALGAVDGKTNKIKKIVVKVIL